ncbi:MAG: YcxB family protein [Huintestinicola sp.]|uniref:YcxB family protein n=1 Tax=Huintestinicola sp. TaxID=2981661 RepID=UPI003F1057B1
MNDIYYEFESEIKYRRLNPKLYAAILIIGLLITVPSLLRDILGLIFAFDLIAALAADSELRITVILFAVFFIVRLIILLAAIFIFKAKAHLKFTFRNDSVDILVVPKKRTVTVPYSQITAVRANSLCYFFYTSRNLAYLLSKEAMGNVSNEEFSGFICEHMGIKTVDFIERERKK